METEQPDNPTKTAELFAEKMNPLGYCLDFSLKSLEEEIDKILDLEMGVEPIELIDWQEETNLEAYIGETLCRLFNGKWAGDFHVNKPINFYTSFILFGEYRFFPSHFIQYRVSNGKKSEGTFKEYLEKVKPEIIAQKSNLNK